MTRALPIQWLGTVHISWMVVLASPIFTAVGTSTLNPGLGFWVTDLVGRRPTPVQMFTTLCRCLDLMVFPRFRGCEVQGNCASPAHAGCTDRLDRLHFKLKPVTWHLSSAKPGARAYDSHPHGELLFHRSICAAQRRQVPSAQRRHFVAPQLDRMVAGIESASIAFVAAVCRCPGVARTLARE